MNLFVISIAGLAAVGGVSTYNAGQTEEETRRAEAAADHAAAEVFKIVEDKRIQDARTEVCRLAAETSGDFWPVYEQAVAKDPTIGPAVEISNRCHFFFSGMLYITRERLDELRK